MTVTEVFIRSTMDTEVVESFVRSTMETVDRESTRTAIVSFLLLSLYYYTKRKVVLPK